MVLVKWLKETLEARVKQCGGKTPAKVETARSGQLNDAREQAAIAKLIAVKKALTDYKSQELSVTSLALKINANNALATHTYVELRDAYFKELDIIIQQLTDRLNDGKNLKELIYKVTTEPDLHRYRLKLKRGDVDVLFNSSVADYEDNLHNHLTKIIIDGKDLLDLVVPFNIPKPDESKGYSSDWVEPDYEHGFKALGLTVNSQWPKGFNPKNEVKPESVENLYFKSQPQKPLESQSVDPQKEASKHIGYNVSWLTPETIPNPEDVSKTISTMFNPASVGEILQEYMDGQSVNSLSKSLQTTPTRLKRILNDNALIDMEFAKKLAKHYRTTSQFWMGINNDYQMWLLKNYDEEQEGLEAHDDK